MESKYLEFPVMQTGAKTNKYYVMTKGSRQAIGVIKWFAAWRKYCFYPVNGTLFDPGCLTDIAAFIQERMEERKKVRKLPKSIELYGAALRHELTTPFTIPSGKLLQGKAVDSF